MKRTVQVLTVFVITLAPSMASAGVVINFTGDSQFAPAFASAEATWESILTGYQNGLVVARTGGSTFNLGDTVTDVVIDAVISPIDGVNGVLGQAGPTELVLDAAGFVLATDGTMQFDSADAQSLLDNGSWEDVILHEMGHVLGFGTLWTQNNVYSTGTGEYTGAAGNSFWGSEFGQTGNAAVELGGGPGTANGHWNEIDGGGPLTGITDAQGRDIRDELMTGWLSPNDLFISEMTRGSFQDIGFNVTFSAVPEPSSLFCICGFGFALITRRRRK